jgi:2-dehydro-3-deoxyphosphogluconate aldolase/(4S)-4-hydroxy-2-oxoglutarate aldolase
VSAPARNVPSTALLETGVVAVLRAPAADAYLPVVRALVETGVLCIELTLTTPGTIDTLPDLLSALPAEAEVGVGTVLTVEDALAATRAGAAFLVAPGSDPAVIRAAVEGGTPIYPGAFTPSEVAANWAAGASAVKLFPASTVGPEFIGHLHGPFPGLPIVPSGGIALEQIPAWLDAGAIAVSLGGPLVGGAFRDGDMNALRARARAALRAVADTRRGR